MRTEHIALLEPKPLAVAMEYLFEIRDSYGTVVQSGRVRAAETHVGAAWAAMAISIRRLQTMWMVRVCRMGGEKTFSYLVERTGEHKFELTRYRR